MRNYCAIHEGLMNGSRMILPRVGVGVGGGGGGRGGVGDIGTTPFNLTVGATSRPAFPVAEWEKPETGWLR